MHLRRNPFVWILIAAVVLSSGASFYRYVFANDYIVEYEADCDPETESCFEGCEDDDCTETYAYKQLVRHATELEQACGPDITDCPAAEACLVGDGECRIEYCDLSTTAFDESCVEPLDEEEIESEEGVSASPEQGFEEEELEPAVDDE